MKKLLFGSNLLLLAATLFAQPAPGPGGPPKPPPAAERWKRDSIRLQLYVSLSPAQVPATKNAFLSFYRNMDALVEKQKDKPPRKEEAAKVADSRNVALKTIFSTAQYERFETFRKEFMPLPPRPPHPTNRKPVENL